LVDLGDGFELEFELDGKSSSPSSVGIVGSVTSIERSVESRR
jgi:hypothetical protein